jgi:hypothetical protein
MVTGLHVTMNEVAVLSSLMFYLLYVDIITESNHILVEEWEF